MISDKCIVFEYKGKYAHFLKAEANASAPSYPFPSRTVLMGMVGAILGLSKDSPQILLENSNIAVMGKAEVNHWHTAKLHQSLPAPLPLKIRKNNSGSCSDKKQPKIVTQEWLIKPNFTVFTQLPKEFHDKFEYRVKNRAWHFTPCLGLSEMMADILYLDSVKPERLKNDKYGIITLIRKNHAEFDIETILERNSIIKSIRMPRNVTTGREFNHENYLYEAQGGELFVKTASAYRVGDKIISWL